MPHPPYRIIVIAPRFAVAMGIVASLCGCVPPAAPMPRGSRSSLDGDMAQESAVLRERAQSHAEEQKRRVERVGRRLLETIPGHPKVQFVIASGDPSINAGATFGQVAITSGMLNFVKSDDEMAMVLGHELAHIEQGHVLKGTMGGLALNVLAIVLDSRVPGAGQAAGGVGQLFLNHYTQNQEREADRVGLGYAYAAGYDPMAAVDLQERLAVEVPQSMSAGYFDTHPSSVERAVAARDQARELLAGGDPPGREQALALERADRVPSRPSRSRDEASIGARSERPRSSSLAAADADTKVSSRGSEGCRRAAVYQEMARDSRDPAQQQELLQRARRYCSAAEAQGGEDADVPADRY
ncbi:MAG TPA: M48 family metallopeptidase [Candidatus Binatia bacterium]|nr:M48 family metallopeptidase [Candidatus Binatia bacterium]